MVKLSEELKKNKEGNKKKEGKDDMLKKIWHNLQLKFSAQSSPFNM